MIEPKGKKPKPEAETATDNEIPAGPMPESVLRQLKSEAYDLIARKEQFLNAAEQMQQALNAKNQEIAQASGA